MRLVELPLELSQASIPANISRLISDAQERIADLEDESRASIPAFVPSDFELVYRGLLAINSANLATGRRLLEWGSGIGVVTCLAVSVGFDAVGIEIEPRLVRIAEELAKTHRIATQFICGSFVPEGAEPQVDFARDVNWLSTGGPDGYEELELEPDDFDVVFAYPWPGEEQVIFDLFASSTAVGALLLTYHGLEGLRLHRKVKR
jgi:predicted O-methyltransferase YrrM